MNVSRFSGPRNIAILAIICFGLINACTDDSTGIDPNEPSEFHFLQDTIYAKVEEPVEFTAVVTGYAATLLNSITYGDNSPQRNVGLTSDTLRLQYTYISGGTFNAVLQAGDDGVFLDTCVVVVEGGYRPEKATTVTVRITGIEFTYENVSRDTSNIDSTWTEIETEFLVNLTNKSNGSNPVATPFVWDGFNTSAVDAVWQPSAKANVSLKGVIDLDTKGNALTRLSLERIVTDTTGDVTSKQRVLVWVMDLPIEEESKTLTYAKFTKSVEPEDIADIIHTLNSVHEESQPTDPIYRKRELKSFTKETTCVITVELTE